MGIFDSSPLPSSPTSQRLETSSISPWAQPYVSSYLDRAQGLINQAPTGFQNQVYSSAQNMGMPEQFAMGTGLANQGGQGALSTAPMALNYGQMGANTGQQGIGIGAMGQQYGMGAGQNYINQATNPNAVGAFMNPFIQQSLAPQLALLNQQQQLGAQGIAAKAVGQGAFGGNRATLAQGLNAQNYDLARQQAIGQGFNEAFRQAQQAQQFGSQLGLQGAMQGTQAGLAGIDTALKGTGLGLQGVSGAQQGYQGATQAGAALGNIGAQQGQYELAKLALQNQIANQQYNQPFQNLEFQRSMLSGLPVASSSTQGFQAPPNRLSQIAGLGSTIIGGVGLANKAGLFDFLKGGRGGSGITYGDDGYTTSAGDLITSDGYSDLFAKGGEVKRYAKGGKVNYATGGDIDLMPTDQLAPLMQNPNIDPMEAALIQQELMIRARMASNPQTPQIMGGGLDTIPSGDMFRAAGGGIVAFAEGGKSQENPVDDYLAQYTDKKGNVDLNKAALSLLGQARPAAETDSATRQEIMQDIKERGETRPYDLALRFGLGALSGTSPYAGANLGAAGIDTLNTLSKDVAAERTLKRELAKLDAEGAAKDDARRLQLAGTLLQIQGQKDIKEASLAAARASAGDPEYKALAKAQALANNDPVIKGLVKQQKDSGAQPGSPDYQYYEDRIAERNAQIFTFVGLKPPPVTESKIQPPPAPVKEPGFFDKIFGSKKAEAPKNKVVPFSQLPS
jgi:hypothetical protein